MSKKRVSSQSVRQSAKRREEEARQRRNSQIRATVIAVVGVLLVVAVVYAITVLFLGDSEDSDSADSSATPVSDLGEAGPLAEVAPAERLNYYEQPPEMTIDPDKDYEAIIRTENGDMRLRLFAAESPETVNNFVFLARQGFYDGTVFHRVMKDFMAQGGDPTGTGTGGPGYQFADEVDNGLTFDRAGLLAMANSGANTNGSQFFITYVPTTWLDGDHTIFGELIDGQDVLDSLTAYQAGSSEVPQSNVIERVDIIES